jgi:hypothetical protein
MLKDLGKSALSASYPNDIEYYLCAFELVNSTDNPEESYFVFPVQPSAIQKSEPTRTNVKKSMSGITVLRNSSFVPQEINIKGNFGKNFKLLADLQGFAWGGTPINNGEFNFDTPSFSTTSKTGYGCIKILQKILEDSQKLDSNGKPKKLYFYNLGFGESYLVIVPPSGMSFSQTEDQNMIWSYQVNMTILTSLSKLSEDTVQSSSKSLVNTGVIQKGPSGIVDDIKTFLGTASDVAVQFKTTTGYDIEGFFNNFALFINTHYQNIINYYNGSDIDQTSFNYLDFLKNELIKIEPLIDQCNNSFNTTDFWTINNIFSDIQTKLETCDNMGRWMRSSRVGRYSSTLTMAHIQTQNETLEKISARMGFSDQDAWTDLALSNQVVEEDYTNKGGRLLNVRIPNSSVFNIQNVVDYLTAENVYGKDIVCKFEIQSDGGLATVTGRDSLRQTFGTIMSTISGSIPEFPNDGVPDYVYGTNRNIIQYPMIFRSLLAMIQKDKRFTGLELLNIKRDQDAIFMSFQASTIVGSTFVQNIPI